MKFPSLVRKQDCKIPAKITIYKNDISEDGAPEEAGTITANCNYQSTGSKINDEQKTSTVISGVLYFNGDIFKTIDEISNGIVIIFDEERQIEKVTKARNPDGTVNYTKIEVI